LQPVEYFYSRLRFATGAKIAQIKKLSAMKQTLVQYKIKAERVQENEQLVRAVYQQLEQDRLPGFQYMTLKLQDGQTFIHIAFAETAEVNDAFTHLSAFQQFRENIKDRCEQAPLSNKVELIGAFGQPFTLAVHSS